MTEIPVGTTPVIAAHQIKKYIEKLKTNKANVRGDIPAKILKENSDLLCAPLADIVNTSLRTCSWPDRF